MTTPSSASRLREAWPVGAAAALALALGLWKLGRQSFGLDEGVSAYTASLPFDQVLSVVTEREPNNILYFDFLYLWEKLGTSEALLRLPSVIAYVAAVPLAAAIAWRCFGRYAGIAAGFLVALNAFAIEMAQEARAYALLLALVCASTLCFMLAVERPTPRRWLLWAVVSIAAAYAHPFALLVLGAQMLSLAWLPPGRAPWRSAAIAGGAVSVAALPLLVLLVADGSGRISWIDSPTPGVLLENLERLSGSNGPELVILYGALAAALLVGVIRRRPTRSLRAWREMLVLLWLILPLVLAIAISLIQPMFFHRYLIVVQPALAIVAAGVLIRLRPPALAVAVLVALGALHLPGVLDWYRSDLKEDWRAMADVMSARAAPNEPILYTNYGAASIYWYLDQGTDDPKPGAAGVYPIDYLSPEQREQLRAAPVRLWLVERADGDGEFDEDARGDLLGRPPLREWSLNKLRVTLLGR